MTSGTRGARAAGDRLWRGPSRGVGPATVVLALALVTVVVVGAPAVDAGSKPRSGHELASSRYVTSADLAPAASAGKLLAVWADYHRPANDYRAYARLLGPDGRPERRRLLLSGPGKGYRELFHVSVAWHAARSQWLAAWVEAPAYPRDQVLRARWVTAAGRPATEPFTIAKGRLEGAPRISCASTGACLVVWSTGSRFKATILDGDVDAGSPEDLGRARRDGVDVPVDASIGWSDATGRWLVAFTEGVRTRHGRRPSVVVENGAIALVAVGTDGSVGEKSRISGLPLRRLARANRYGVTFTVGDPIVAPSPDGARHLLAWTGDARDPRQDPRQSGLFWVVLDADGTPLQPRRVRRVAEGLGRLASAGLDTGTGRWLLTWRRELDSPDRFSRRTFAREIRPTGRPGRRTRLAGTALVTATAASSRGPGWVTLRTSNRGLFVRRHP